MFKNIKLAFQSFKKSWADYLAISFVFGVIVTIAFLIGQSLVGMLIAFVAIIVPAIISLKFCVFQAYDKPQVEYRSLKIGFITFFKSIKIYMIVILKPLLIGSLVGLGVMYLFTIPAVNIASKTMPNLLETMYDAETFMYIYEDMLKIEEVKNLLTIGSVVSLILGYLVFFALKLKRDFIPFVAFEMPITSKRAVAMNEKVLKGNYFKFFLSNFIVLLMFLVPGAITFFVYSALVANPIYSPFTISLISSMVMSVLSSPIVTFAQLHYIHSYKSLSKPFKEDFDNELKNVIKEIEELQKIIDKNDEK